MGYFDSVKAKPRLEVVKSVTTPTPRREAPGLHSYAAFVRDAELSRLEECKGVPVGHKPSWDDTTFEVACNLIEIANSPWSGYSLAEARSDLFASAPRDDGFDERRIEQKWISAEKRVGLSGRPEPTPQEAPSLTVLSTPEAAPIPDLEPVDEDAFWDSRPLLRHLHDFARARMVSPWAVLGITLARIVTATPHQVHLPPTIGGKASLNQFVGVVGPSGSGKGAAEAVAAEALLLGKHIVSYNVGSGEGIAHGFMHRAKGELKWNDDDHAVLFSVPEIDSLAAQGDRRGATLMPQLRSAWTGEALGFGYADPTKRILIPSHEYRLCLVAGIQPARAACLLDDADGGTPQRFLWMPATDPGAPDVAPPEPEPMTWGGVQVGRLVTFGGVRMKVCDVAVDLIKSTHLARVRGQGHGLDGHALLARLKVAAALALADSRLEVIEEDWDLSEVIARKSAAVRGQVVATLNQRKAEENAARAEAEASRAVRIDERKADEAVRRVCSVIVRRLRREGDWLASHAVRKALAGRDREHFQAALDRLVDAGQIEVDETATGHGNRVGKYRLKEQS